MSRISRKELKRDEFVEATKEAEHWLEENWQLVAKIAAGIAAVYPVLPFYEQVAMIATLAVFLNALALYMLARFAESSSRRWMRNERIFVPSHPLSVR